MRDDLYDVAIVGGGIIGIASAYFISDRFKARVVVLEKESELASHQTGRNSGVIHSGIYYQPGSSKAELCTAGRESLYEFCLDNSIEFKRCGKIIVATNPKEETRLGRLFDFGTANGLRSLRILDQKELKKIEPHAAGVAALNVADAGIVNYSDVTKKLAELAVKKGCYVRTKSELLSVNVTDRGTMILNTASGKLESQFLINCGGLQTDRIAIACGVSPGVRIIPFRGEYFSLAKKQSGLVNGLIYPVPDPDLPFLGVHLTKKLSGAVEIGPNAIFATGRQAYRGFKFKSIPDLASSLSYPGFWKLAFRHWKTGLGEIYRSLNTRAMLAEIKKLVPAIEGQHIRKTHSGIRAQAVSGQGDLLNDFLIEQGHSSIHVLNAPSPAATASLAIGKHITDIAEEKFDLRAK